VLRKRKMIIAVVLLAVAASIHQAAGQTGSRFNAFCSFFLPRDAMLARCMLSSCVCLSVRLSVGRLLPSNSITSICSRFIVQLVPTVVRQVTGFRLTQHVARSVCGSRASCISNACSSTVSKRNVQQRTRL